MMHMQIQRRSQVILLEFRAAEIKSGSQKMYYFQSSLHLRVSRDGARDTCMCDAKELRTPVGVTELRDSDYKCDNIF